MGIDNAREFSFSADRAENAQLYLASLVTADGTNLLSNFIAVWPDFFRLGTNKTVADTQKPASIVTFSLISAKSECRGYLLIIKLSFTDNSQVLVTDYFA